MKRGLIITIIFCVILFFVGGILLVIGVVSGGKAAFNIDYKNHKLRTSDNMKLVTKDVEISEFEKMDINIGTADLIIKEGDTYSLKYALYEGEEPTIGVNEGTLTVKTNKEQSFINFNVFGLVNNDTNPYVEITVPAKTVLKDSEIVVAAGDATFSDIEVEEMNIKSAAGDVKLKNFISHNSKVEANAGDISIDSSEIDTLETTISAGELNVISLKSEELNVKNDYGDIEITSSEITDSELIANAGSIELEKTRVKNIDVESSYGDVNLGLIGEEADYDMDLTVAAGDCEISGKDVGKNHNVKKGREKNINVASAAGDIEISFNE